MAFVCVVCRELLTNDPQEERDNTGSAAGGATAQVNIEIVAIQCGHMYHRICLNNWFNKQANLRKECPYCKRTVMGRDYQRLFPVGDEETDDIESRLQLGMEKEIQLQAESAILKSKIEQLESALKEARTQLQHKTLGMNSTEKVLKLVRTKNQGEMKQLKEVVQIVSVSCITPASTTGSNLVSNIDENKFPTIVIIKETNANQKMTYTIEQRYVPTIGATK